MSSVLKAEGLGPFAIRGVTGEMFDARGQFFDPVYLLSLVRAAGARECFPLVTYRMKVPDLAKSDGYGSFKDKGHYIL